MMTKSAFKRFDEVENLHGCVKFLFDFQSPRPKFPALHGKLLTATAGLRSVYSRLQNPSERLHGELWLYVLISHPIKGAIQTIKGSSSQVAQVAMAT
jgi:hypothetical protein